MSRLYQYFSIHLIYAGSVNLLVKKYQLNFFIHALIHSSISTGSKSNQKLSLISFTNCFFCSFINHHPEGSTLLTNWYGGSVITRSTLLKIFPPLRISRQSQQYILFNSIIQISNVKYSGEQDLNLKSCQVDTLYQCFILCLIYNWIVSNYSFISPTNSFGLPQLFFSPVSS